MAERPASVALVIQQSSHLFFYWHSFVESATPKEMIFDQPEVTIAIINVQDYDLSDHQFVRLTLGAQKGISSEIVLVPRELVILIYEGKHGSSMLGFSGAKDKSGIFPY